MLHRVIFGSVERFIGILIEHYAGAFPLWLAPDQIRILPVNPEIHHDFAHELMDQLLALGFRVEVDERNEKLGYRLREAQMKKVPVQLTIGDKEVENKEVNCRRYGSQASETVKVEDMIKHLLSEVKEKR
jgi:threonyl-tRNA synthetase